MSKIGINGFGRIGRMTLRAILQNPNVDLDVVAINDLTSTDMLAYLLKYDSTHGILDAEISHDAQNIIVNGKAIRVYSERNPADIPWAAAGVDIVLECTGFFTDAKKAQAHIDAGAKKVIISAPASNEDATFAVGINHTLVLPDLKGKLDGFAVRVPTIDVSIVDLTFTASKPVTVQAIHDAMLKAANGELKGVLEYMHDPLVSVDFIGNAHSSIYDPTMTRVLEGNLVKIGAWYDNETGYSNRLAELTQYVALKTPATAHA